MPYGAVTRTPGCNLSKTNANADCAIVVGGSLPKQTLQPQPPPPRPEAVSDPGKNMGFGTGNPDSTSATVWP